jgi:filamentous hemagglutinin
VGITGGNTAQINQGATSGGNAAANNRMLHPNEREILKSKAKEYAKLKGISEVEANKLLMLQMTRFVDSTAAANTPADYEAIAYLQSVKAQYASQTAGQDQWGNPVQMFGANSSQRNDSTMFSDNPQKTNPPKSLDLNSVVDYAKGMGKTVINKVSHPLDTLVDVVNGIVGLVTDPDKVLTAGQAQVRNITHQAGEGNFKPAGAVVGDTVGTAVVTSIATVGAVKAVPVVANAAGNLATEAVVLAAEKAPAAIKVGTVSAGAGTDIVTTVISNVTVIDRKLSSPLVGNVELQSTIDRIGRGEQFPHRNDGSTFKNNEGLLPSKASGYYTEYVVPTSGASGPSVQRLVVGAGGEIYYTPNHYKTFIPVNSK